MTFYIDMASSCGIVTTVHDKRSNLGERRERASDANWALECFETNRYLTNYQDSTLEASLRSLVEDLAGEGRMS